MSWGGFAGTSLNDPKFEGFSRLDQVESAALVRKCLPPSQKGRWRGGKATYMMGAGPESGPFLPPFRVWRAEWRRRYLSGQALLKRRKTQTFAAGLLLEGARIRMAKGDDDRRNNGRDDGTGTAVITRTKTQTKRPNLYRVLLLNDDYTPMEFVVHVLERFFNKQREDATRIMLHVHQNGVGECGIFTYEVAETKVTQVMDFARKHQHPLQCVMEKK
jgi:ATP-dependent Clp protease adaptor protein ClpS